MSISVISNWLAAHPDLVAPLIFSLVIAGIDMRTRRIPNYLTFTCAAGGLGFQAGVHGWAGLGDGVLGLILGLLLLMLPYLKGGMGAGDVKALAALGAWLGPGRTFSLFIFVGLSGGLLIVAVLWWRGVLWAKVRKAWASLVSWILWREPLLERVSPSGKDSTRIPYGAALALGMAILCWHGPLKIF